MFEYHKLVLTINDNWALFKTSHSVPDNNVSIRDTLTFVVV